MISLEHHFKMFEIVFLVSITIKYTSSSTTYYCASTVPCGCSINPAVLSKIVGGEIAPSQTWGWAASIRYKTTNSHFCGGSIISDSHILTAAHCTTELSSPSLIRIHVGSIYLSTTIQVRDVSKIFIHPNYSATTYNNDISILKLSSPLNLDQNGVDLVCLPNVSSAILENEEYPAPNTKLVAIGWGYTSENSDILSSTLQQVTIQAISASSSYCRNAEIANPATQFCAGIMPEGGKDTCQGDSGSPLLMFNLDNVWEQVGITSSGIGCARPFYPGIYTRVAAYRSWINETVKNGSYKIQFLPVMAISLILKIIL